MYGPNVQLLMCLCFLVYVWIAQYLEEVGEAQVFFTLCQNIAGATEQGGFFAFVNPSSLLCARIICEELPKTKRGEPPKSVPFSPPECSTMLQGVASGCSCIF